MAKPPPFADVAAVHRWFGVETNNRAWTLVEKPTRTPAEDRELLALTHASTYHWSHIAEPINELRGLVLLTHAHALAGSSATACGYAQSLMEALEQEPEGLTDFDRASAFAACAAAYAADGQPGVADGFDKQAAQVAERFDDAMDRTVLERLLAARR